MATATSNQPELFAPEAPFHLPADLGQARAAWQEYTARERLLEAQPHRLRLSCLGRTADGYRLTTAAFYAVARLLHPNLPGLLRDLLAEERGEPQALGIFNGLLWRRRQRLERCLLVACDDGEPEIRAALPRRPELLPHDVFLDLLEQLPDPDKACSGRQLWLQGRTLQVLLFDSVDAGEIVFSAAVLLTNSADLDLGNAVRPALHLLRGLGWAAGNMLPLKPRRRWCRESLPLHVAAAVRLARSWWWNLGRAALQVVRPAPDTADTAAHFAVLSRRCRQGGVPDQVTRAILERLLARRQDFTWREVVEQVAEMAGTNRATRTGLTLARAAWKLLTP